jgi:type II secretory pathway pseudopilin PulG
MHFFPNCLDIIKKHQKTCLTIFRDRIYYFNMENHETRGMALISMIISLLIMALLIYVALTLYSGGKDNATETITVPIERGRAVQCLAQIRKVETAIQMYLAENGRYPSSLNEVDDLTKEDFYCPVTNNLYNYNPRTGKITCPDHNK